MTQSTTDATDGAWHKTAAGVAGKLGMDRHVYGYHDVDPEELRRLHIQTVLGIESGILPIGDKHLNLGVECKHTNICVTMIYSRGKFACPQDVIYLPSFPKPGADSDVDSTAGIFTNININSPASSPRRKAKKNKSRQ